MTPTGPQKVETTSHNGSHTSEITSVVGRMLTERKHVNGTSILAPDKSQEEEFLNGANPHKHYPQQHEDRGTDNFLSSLLVPIKNHLFAAEHTEQAREPDANCDDRNQTTRPPTIREYAPSTPKNNPYSQSVKPIFS